MGDPARTRASRTASISFGLMTRSKNRIDEHSRKRSSSVTEKRARWASSSDERMSKRRRAVECGEGALDPPLPSVRQRECSSLVLVRRGDRSSGAQALALGRAALELPGEAGQQLSLLRWSAPRRPDRSVSAPPRRRDSARADDRRRRPFANEEELPPGSGARGVEEVAVARNRIRPHRTPRPLPAVSSSRRVSSGRNGGLGGARGNTPSSSRRKKTACQRLVRARMRSTSADTARLGGAAEPHLGAIERPNDCSDEISPPSVRQPSSSSRRPSEASCVRRSILDFSPTGGESSP